MSTVRLRCSFAPALVLLLAALTALPALAADDEDQRNVVRLGANYVNVVKSTRRVSRVPLDELDVRYVFDDGTTGFLSWERRIGQKTGLALSVSQIDLDLVAETARTTIDPVTFAETFTRGSIGGQTTMTPIELALIQHAGSGERWDFYFGGFLAWVMYDDLSIEAPPEILQLSAQLPDDGSALPLDDKLGWGALVGLDWRTRPDGKWRFSLSARRLFTRAETTAPGNNLVIDIDPWEWRLGIGLSF